MTSMHIFSDTSDQAVFNYEYDDYFTAEIGDEFNFNDYYYGRLPEKYKKNFDKLNLSTGSYIVENAYEEETSLLGKVSYIFIKPKLY